MRLPTSLQLAACSGLFLLASPLCAQDKAGQGEAYVFPNAHLLVSIDWVGEFGADDGVVVVDTRSSKDYGQGHIPDAVHLPTSDTFDPAHMGDIASAAAIAKHLGARGITADTHVVLYDWGKSTDAARVMWTLETYGHKQVSVVDGGFVKWKKDDFPSSREAAKPEAVEYILGKPTTRLSTREEIITDLDDEQCMVLDSRSTREYSSGRIPGAVHIDWLENFTPDDSGSPILLAPAALHKLYVDQGVTLDKRLHAY
ncbi:MAG: thiosulfate/3-mercaptopyruvate sulfurtransferase [Planctomycetota bacterium]|jgi:thiosulfate/3-mercaptopyruvate sulfurtransferase